MISVNYKSESGKTSSVFIQRPNGETEEGEVIEKKYSSEDVPEGKKSVIFMAGRKLEEAGIELSIPCPKYSSEERATLSGEQMRLGLVVPASYSQAFEDQFKITEEFDPSSLGE